MSRELAAPPSGIGAHGPARLDRERTGPARPRRGPEPAIRREKGKGLGRFRRAIVRFGPGRTEAFCHPAYGTAELLDAAYSQGQVRSAFLNSLRETPARGE